jgi:hypothetical protein
MMGRVFEIPQQEGFTKVGMFNQQVRDDVANVVAAIGIGGPAPARIEEAAPTNNAITLPAGRNFGCHLTVEDTTVKALSAGCYMTRMAIVEEDAVFDGIHFATSEDNADELVRIRSPAVVVFRNCTFEKGATSTQFFIRIEVGAKTLFVGCVFKGNPTAAGNIINNPNPAADCQIVGCYNKTTHAFGTTTTTASL